MVSSFRFNFIILWGWCKVGKRFFALFAAFTVLFFVSVPAFATGMTPGGVGGGVAGIPVVGEIQLDVVDFSRYCDDKVRGYGNFIWHLIDNDVCSHAPQLGGSHNFVPRRTQVDGQIGTYYVCEYCGRASGEVLEEAYDEYVADTYGSCTRYDGSGNIPVNLVINGVSGSVYRSIYPYATLDLTNVTGSTVVGGLTCSFLPGEVSFSTSGTAVRFYSHSLTCSFVAPVSGTLVVSSGNAYTVTSFSNSSFNRSGSFGGATRGVSAGDSVSLSFSAGVNSKDSQQWTDIRISYGVFDAYIVPLGALGTMYDTDTRVSGGNVSGSGTGLYGYVQDGQLYQSTVGTIYNETTNIYQNPVTGETKDVSNWTYDYSDRSYTLTTDEGDTVKVTYGDTNVTINDGGTTYNVYYLTEHDESVPEHYYTSSVTLAPTCTGTGVRTYTCDDCGDTYTETIPATGHSHQSAVTMPPTCVNTGVKTFTCSVCGDSYTQSIPATGHTWTVTKTVPNQYDDETGELTQAGYTLYGCSTCGEQYRIDAASSGETLPSPSTGGTSIDTGNSGGEALTPDIDSSVGRGFLATIAHGLTEDLPEVLELISEWFKTVPALYNGYSNFLAASFAWMPPDCVMLLTFSVGMVTVIAICRAMFRR